MPHSSMPQPTLSFTPLDETARRNLISAQRSLQGLAAVMEVLEANQLDYQNAVAEPLLGEHLVDGLLVAGRQLVVSARTALDSA